MMKRKKMYRRLSAAAGTAVALAASLAMPLTAQAKVDGYTFEVEVHAESEGASLTDGKAISTTTGYGLGVQATNGYTATIDVGDVTATNATGYGRAAELLSRSKGTVEANLGNVETGGSGYVSGLSAYAWGGTTSVTAGKIKSTIDEGRGGYSFAMQANGNNGGDLTVTVGDVDSASNGIDFGISGDGSKAKITTGNIEAGKAGGTGGWNNVSSSGGAEMFAELGNVSSETRDGLTVQASDNGSTVVVTGSITSPKKALNLNSHGGSLVALETGNLTSTDDCGIYAWGGSGKNGDFVMVNVDGDIYANGTGIVAGQAGKYLVYGDVTSVESDGVFFGDGSEHTAVLVTGTLKAGRNGVAGLSNADVRNNADLTVWKISAGEDMFSGDDGTFAKKVYYIVKKKEGQEDLIKVTKKDDSALDKDFGYEVANEGDRIYVTAESDDSCVKYKAYNGTGSDKKALPEDSKGYYLDVEAGGGIYLSVEKQENHEWTYSKFNWEGNKTDGYTGANALYVCNKNAQHEKLLKALITTKVTAPTCENNGFTTYIATVTADKSLDKKEHTEKKKAKETQATGHDWDAGKVTTEPTCTKKGVKTFTCKNDSSHTKTEDVPALGHKEGKAVKENVKAAGCEKEGSYDSVVYCTICNTELSRTKKTTPATGHDWDEGEVTTKATCTKPGVRTFTCKNDSTHTYTEEIPVNKKAHSWNPWTVTKEATELEEGEEHRVCKNDPDHTQTRVIPVKDHVHQLTKVDEVKATCTKEGNIEYYICNKGENPCGRFFSDAEGTLEILEEDTLIPATGHIKGKAVRENVVDATCENEGSYDNVIYCTQCNIELSRTKKTIPVDPNAHTWSRGVVIKEATCTGTGIMEYTCQNDESHKYTEDIPATGHKWGEATYTWAEDDSKVTAAHTCEIDGESEEETVDTVSTVVKEPTVDEEGEMEISATFTQTGFEKQTKTVAIPKKEKEDVTYWCESGDGNQWTIGSAEDSQFVFKRSAEDDTTVDHLTGVFVGDTALSADAYELERGSAIITLKPEYLNTLDAGEYTLLAQFDDGSAEAGFKVVAAQGNNKKKEEKKQGKKVVKKTGSISAAATGDESNGAMWIVAAGAAAGIVAAAVVGFRRKKKVR